MKDIMKNLEYRGKSYKVVFNLNVLEAIQEEYGSFEKWGELTGGEEANVKAMIFGYAAMLNEGIDIENDEKGTNEKPLTLKQVGRMLSEIGMGIAAATMQETVIASTQAGEESKNESSKTKTSQS